MGRGGGALCSSKFFPHINCSIIFFQIQKFSPILNVLYIFSEFKNFLPYQIFHIFFRIQRFSPLSNCLYFYFRIQFSPNKFFILFFRIQKFSQISYFLYYFCLLTNNFQYEKFPRNGTFYTVFVHSDFYIYSKIFSHIQFSITFFKFKIFLPFQILTWNYVKITSKHTATRSEKWAIGKRSKECFQLADKHFFAFFFARFTPSHAKALENLSTDIRHFSILVVDVNEWESRFLRLNAAKILISSKNASNKSWELNFLQKTQ